VIFGLANENKKLNTKLVEADYMQGSNPEGAEGGYRVTEVDRLCV
jgi:hypothetical protein